MYFYLVNKDIIIIIVIVIIIKTINGKSYKNIESYKISNINVSRTAAIIRSSFTTEIHNLHDFSIYLLMLLKNTIESGRKNTKCS